MAGPFPPPVIGSAVITAAWRDALFKAGYKVCEINTAGDLVQEGLFFRVRRRLRIAGRLAVELIRQERGSTVYISFAGEGGQLGDLLNVILARLFRRPIILHHHSFAYIRTPRVLTRCVFGLAGHRARHIFLCGAMRREAMRIYSSVGRGYVVSNMAHMELATAAQTFGPLKKIGFLSNLAETKGIDRFIELARRVRKRNEAVSFEVAGPYRDVYSREITQAAVNEGIVTYHGAQMGDAKKKFFDMIDVLVLPSRYPHEAEPLVILEAFAAGVPVIATNRGCIADLISGEHGLLLDANADKLDPAIEQIEDWKAHPDTFAAARRAAITRAAELQSQSLATFELVLRHMVRRLEGTDKSSAE